MDGCRRHKTLRHPRDLLRERFIVEQPTRCARRTRWGSEVWFITSVPGLRAGYVILSLRDPTASRSGHPAFGQLFGTHRGRFWFCFPCIECHLGTHFGLQIHAFFIGWDTDGRVAPVEIPISTGVAKPQEVSFPINDHSGQSDFIRGARVARCLVPSASSACGTKVARGRATCATLRACPRVQLFTDFTLPDDFSMEPMPAGWCLWSRGLPRRGEYYRSLAGLEV